MKYAVMRPHLGDKWYGTGDEREAKESSVAHLVKSGVLVGADQVEKERPDENKTATPDSNQTQSPVDTKTGQVEAVKAAD